MGERYRKRERPRHVCYVPSVYAFGSHSPYTYPLTHISTDPTPTPSSTYTLRGFARRTPVKTTTKGEGASERLRIPGHRVRADSITPWTNGIRCTYIAA
jgi:hypothetical protein